MLRRDDTDAPRGTIVYCVVPRDLAAKLHESLRRHFREDPTTEVIVEERQTERRRTCDRRAARVGPAEERRRIRGGRRVADRRAAAMPIEPPDELPRRARVHADRLVFLERVEPPTRQLEDVDTARLVTRIQAGESDAFADLYMRYFDRVYNYFRVAFGSAHEAEDATQQIFMQAFEALPRYERRGGQPFRAWLFVIVRNHAIDQLKRLNRLSTVDPVELSARSERQRPEVADLSALNWITDRDLVLFVERLPFPQRQVLLLRFLLDLSSVETAAVLGMTPPQVRSLQRRALHFLEERLTALGRGSERSDKSVHMRRWGRQARVLRRRRYVLTH